MNSAAVAMAPPVIASTITLSLLLLVAADTRAPVTAPPIMAFFCKKSKEKEWAEAAVLVEVRKFSSLNKHELEMAWLKLCEKLTVKSETRTLW